MRIQLLAIVFAALAAHADDISCRVVGVTDGDTLTCLTGSNEQIKVRLAQIDAPEKAQPIGQRSKESLSDLSFNKNVTLKVETTDRYGRTVATVMDGSTDVNLLQVKRGMAWVYDKYAHDQSYFDAEDAARTGKVGLWVDKKPIEPSKWRKGER